MFAVVMESSNNWPPTEIISNAQISRNYSTPYDMYLPNWGENRPLPAFLPINQRHELESRKILSTRKPGSKVNPEVIST